MSSWSKRRKLTYAGITTILIIGAIVLPAFFYFYKPPTCFDGKQNQGEQGIDCGGPCQKLCPSAFLSANASWTRFEEVAPGLYNLAAYIVNPNVDGEALNVPYRMVLFDTQGIPIANVPGTLTLPPHRNTLVFQPAVSVGKRIPSKVLFQFTAIPDWHKNSDPLARLGIGGKDYSEDSTGSSLSVTLTNSDVRPLGRINVGVVLYDKDGNAVGFSKTAVDQVPAQGSAVAPFTWPVKRGDKVISIEVLPVAE